VIKILLVLVNLLSKTPSTDEKELAMSVTTGPHSDCSDKTVKTKDI